MLIIKPHNGDPYAGAARTPNSQWSSTEHRSSRGVPIRVAHSIVDVEDFAVRRQLRRMQDLALTTMFTHRLHRDRTGRGAHLPHVRHRRNLPA
jgi:hypothetical protein